MKNRIRNVCVLLVAASILGATAPAKAIEVQGPDGCGATYSTDGCETLKESCDQMACIWSLIIWIDSYCREQRRSEANQY